MCHRARPGRVGFFVSERCLAESSQSLKQIPGAEVKLNTKRKHAVLVSASLATRSSSLQTDLKFALEEAFTPAELVELILQSLLFDGYPCALEGLITLKNLVPNLLPAEEILEKYSQESIESWIHRGKALCQDIYGDNFDRLLNNVGSLSPTLKEWMLVEGYGRVLARPGLGIDFREMGIIAILTVKGLPRQLHSHLRGALCVGVTASELQEAIYLCGEYAGTDKIESALGVWRRLGSSAI